MKINEFVEQIKPIVLKLRHLATQLYCYPHNKQKKLFLFFL